MKGKQLMNNQLTTPNIEKLKAREMSVTLYADMTLAMVPVTITGQYNVHSNCYYPSMVQVNMTLEDDGIREGQMYSLEDFCEKMGWDQYQTHDEIQEAVEKRDQ